MSESYDGSYLLSSLQQYIKCREEGTLDGFEFVLPSGYNTLDPLFLIRYAKMDAELDDQVALTKSMILGKKVEVKLFGEVIGSFQLSSIDQSFGSIDLFMMYPYALEQLIKTCWISSLKNLIPPLSSSQLATKEAQRKARVDLAKSSGEGVK